MTHVSWKYVNGMMEPIENLSQTAEKEYVSGKTHEKI